MNSAGAGVFMPCLASPLSNHQETAGDSAFILPLILSFFKVYLYMPSTVGNTKVIFQKSMAGGRKANWEATHRAKME